MTLKSYLEMDPAKRAAWTHLADKLLAKYDKKSSTVQEGTHLNPFLQKWKPKANGKLPEFLKGMLKVAKKFGVEFDTLQPTKGIRESLPLWHHIGENPEHIQINNSPQCKCLRARHGVSTVGDGLAVMARLVCPTHVEDRWCVCEPCSNDRRERGCTNPHACALSAKSRLDLLISKWDPRSPDPPDLPPPPQNDGVHPFVPPPKITKLSDGFRIFTKPVGDPIVAPPAGAPPVSNDASPIRVAIGSHCEFSGSTDARAAFGVVFAHNDLRNSSARVPNTVAPLRNSAEVVAALVA
ncbi:hypothetical protein DFH09DRAFT_836281, partial [Mycena vulgaris]